MIINITRNELSYAEAEAVLGEIKCFDNYIIGNGDVSRLAYAKKAFEEFDVSKMKGTFSVRVPQNKSLEKEYGETIQKKSGCKVKLTNPENEIYVFFFDRKYITKLVYERTQDYKKRLPNKMPAPHPASLHPLTARAMINLSGADTFIDPFCGAGGILNEAWTLRIKAQGYDIDKKMIFRAKKNTNQPVMLKDALSLPECDYVVTDMPYGKSTKISKDLKQLYDEFFLVLSKKVKIRAVVGICMDVNLHGMKKINEFEIRLNRNLCRKIIVVEPNTDKR